MEKISPSTKRVKKVKNSLTVIYIGIASCKPLARDSDSAQKASSFRNFCVSHTNSRRQANLLEKDMNMVSTLK